MFNQEKKRMPNQFKIMLSKLIDHEIFAAGANQYKISALCNQRGVELVKRIGINVLIKYESTTLAALCSENGKVAERLFGEKIYSLPDHQLHFLCTELGMNFTERAGLQVLQTFTNEDIRQLKISRIEWDKIKVIDPQTLSGDLLFEIGHFFTQKVNLSRDDKIGLGIYFMKLIQRQSPEFPSNIIESICILEDPIASLSSRSLDTTKGKILANNITGAMLHEGNCYGFHQLRILLNIAEHFNPTSIKNVDNYVFKELYNGKFVEVANFVFNKLLDADYQLKQKTHMRQP